MNQPRSPHSLAPSLSAHFPSPLTVTVAVEFRTRNFRQLLHLVDRSHAPNSVSNPSTTMQSRTSPQYRDRLRKSDQLEEFLEHRARMLARMYHSNVASGSQTSTLQIVSFE
jgi:hypothetical protein